MARLLSLGIRGETGLPNPEAGRSHRAGGIHLLNDLHGLPHGRDVSLFAAITCD